ncbi:MAG: hypothetical protein KF832_07790 [Caldilineaceae bacterium]|nr:hypothetical protein [Caldilineaceae bacterium]
MSQNRTTRTAPTAEQLLHASRRLDWRFLLPDPALHRVAYWGPTTSTLLRSLQLFATTLAVCPAAQETAPTEYDVVVAATPTAKQLQEAVAAIRPGGLLYLEAHGLLWPATWHRPQRLLQQPRLWQPRDYMALLQRKGLHNIKSFWFWPNFESCTKIVPIDDPVVLAYALGTPTKASSIKAKLKTAYQRWIVQSGWLPLTVPSFGIIAQG